MRKWKRALVAAVVFGVLCTAGAWAEGQKEAGAKEQLVWRHFDNQGSIVQKPENEQIRTLIESKLGFKIQIEDIPDNNFDEKLKLMLASQEEFDSFDLIPLTYTWVDLKNKKMTVPLNDLLTKYGGNVKKVWGDAFKFTTDTEGKIWAFPRCNEVVKGFVTAVREDWLKKLNMKMPSTIMEYEKYLDAVLTTDLNGNGIHDEIPYVPWWGMWGFWLGMRPAFLGVNGSSYVAADGRVMPIYTHPKFKAMLQKLNEWYQKGYLYKEFATASDDKKEELRKANRIGSFNGWWMGGDITLKDGILYSPMPPWKDAPGGISAWGSNPAYDEQVAISATSKHPELFIKYVDWIASDQTNYLTVKYGIEGTDWKWADKGKKLITRIEGYSDRYNNFFNVIDMDFPVLRVQIAPTDVLSADAKRVRDIVDKWPGIPDTQNIWPFALDGTPAAHLTGDGDTMINEAILKTIYGQQPISMWEDTVAQYMKIEGDILTQVKTEQFKKNGYVVPNPQ